MSDSIHIPGGGYRFCHCTNQCQVCGVCCAIGCEHRVGADTVSTTTITIVPEGTDPRRRAEDVLERIRIERPAPRHGWICPVCKGGCSPDVDYCLCNEEEQQT